MNRDGVRPEKQNHENGLTAVVAGASGLVGSHLLSDLLEDSRYSRVILVGRHSLGLEHPSLSEILVDWQSQEPLRLPVADVAFCALGTTMKKAKSQSAFRSIDYELCMKFAAAAKAAGVRKFLLVSAIGADPGSMFFYNRVKGETERDLRRFGFESVVIFRPSLLLGQRKEFRFAEQWAIRLHPYYRGLLKGPLAAHAPVPAASVARSMVEQGVAAQPGWKVVTNAEMLKV